MDDVVQFNIATDKRDHMQRATNLTLANNFFDDNKTSRETVSPSSSSSGFCMFSVEQLLFSMSKCSHPVNDSIPFMIHDLALVFIPLLRMKNEHAIFTVLYNTKQHSDSQDAVLAILIRRECINCLLKISFVCIYDNTDVWLGYPAAAARYNVCSLSVLVITSREKSFSTDCIILHVYMAQLLSIFSTSVRIFQ